MVSDTSFPRHVRLLTSREFQRVFNTTSCKSADAYLTMLACANECGHPRLGLALSKKRIKTAVARNRLKRLIRDSFRHHQQLLPGIDIVVMSQTRTTNLSNNEIYARLDYHWKKLAARCKTQLLEDSN